MGLLVWSTCQMLKSIFEIRLFVPQHFPFKDTDITTEYLSAAKNKYARPLNMVDPRTHIRLINQVKSFQPDAVHIFNSEGYPWSISVALWCKKKQVPLVVTLHDPKAHPGNVFGWINEKLGAITGSCATCIHIFYDAFHSLVEKRYGRPVRVAGYASISHFYLVHRAPGVVRENCVLQFGRLEYYKGIDLLVAAAAFLPPDVKIVIAGAGSLDASTKTAIAALADRFEIHERYITDAEAARLFQRARVLALPYREVTQSLLPGIAAEFGVVTAATDIGFFRDEVPRFGGILVPPDDPKALAKGILDGLSMSPTLPQGGDSALIARQYVEMYRNTIQSM